MIPLIFLAVSSILNVIMDLFFVLRLHWGIPGAAFATILSQWIAGVGIVIYTMLCFRELLPGREDLHFTRSTLKEISNLSILTCLQQSIMNLEF